MILSMTRPLIRIAIFIGAMFVSTIACAVIWQYQVTDNLYHCTDSVGFDYFAGPSGWVHGDVAGHPGDYGDTIKPGWNMAKLKVLWIGFMAISFLLSLLVAWLPKFDKLPLRLSPIDSPR